MNNEITTVGRVTYSNGKHTPMRMFKQNDRSATFYRDSKGFYRYSLDNRGSGFDSTRLATEADLIELFKTVFRNESAEGVD